MEVKYLIFNKIMLLEFCKLKEFATNVQQIFSKKMENAIYAD